MSDDKKLTPEVRDKLVAKLKSNLGRSRPRPWLWALGGMLLTGLLLWVLWHTSQPPPPLPPVMLTLFDGLDGDEYQAQITAPGHPDANLEGLSVRWSIAVPHSLETGVAKTDAHGIARFRQGDGRVSDTPLPKMSENAIEASYVDPRDKSRGREARANLLKARQHCVLVSIDDLAPKNIDWRQTPAPPAPAGGERLVCAAGPVDADTYRAMRAWLNLAGGVNQPILLRESIDELQKRCNDIPRRKPAVQD